VSSSATAQRIWSAAVSSSALDVLSRREQQRAVVDTGAALHAPTSRSRSALSPKRGFQSGITTKAFASMRA
jgi:hypothetical protein